MDQNNKKNSKRKIERNETFKFSNEEMHIVIFFIASKLGNYRQNFNKYPKTVNFRLKLPVIY